jgi:hypothetical protein
MKKTTPIERSYGHFMEIHVPTISSRQAPRLVSLSRTLASQNCCAIVGVLKDQEHCELLHDITQPPFQCRFEPYLSGPPLMTHETPIGSIGVLSGKHCKESTFPNELLWDLYLEQQENKLSDLYKQKSQRSKAQEVHSAQFPSFLSSQSDGDHRNRAYRKDC